MAEGPGHQRAPIPAHGAVEEALAPKLSLQRGGCCWGGVPHGDPQGLQGPSSMEQ